MRGIHELLTLPIRRPGQLLALVQQVVSTTTADHADFHVLRQVEAQLASIASQIEVLRGCALRQEHGRVILESVAGIPASWSHSKELLLSLDAYEVQ